MKLLVFAHTPPPHHGQSYMVELMLKGFGGDQRQRGATRRPGPLGIECYHVNARVSRELGDIGDMRLGKCGLLFWYCLQAIWCRFRYGVTTFYYVPAPGKNSALFRDWFVMWFCRPFFKRLILHWHAAGLAKWLETTAHIRSRSLTFRLMKHADLSIVLSGYNRIDAQKLFARRIRVISNGVPDPCPEFDQDVLPRRLGRQTARQKLLSGGVLTPQEAHAAGEEPHVVKVLFLAHCTVEKGLFDAMEGVRLANLTLRQQRSALRLRLLAAGNFVTGEERNRFYKLLEQPELKGDIEYLGFVSGEQKVELLREADLFCFPTFYRNENQPVNLIEAMAFGLPVVTTRWRSLPELFPPAYAGLVDPHAPGQVAEALLSLTRQDGGLMFRDIFKEKFTIEQHLQALASAMLETQNPVPSTAVDPVLSWT